MKRFFERGHERGIRADYRETVRANWRVIFRFEDNHVVDVDHLDYHWKGMWHHAQAQSAAPR